MSLQKGVYPYEQMNDWGKINKASLPEKIDFLLQPYHNLLGKSDKLLYFKKFVTYFLNYVNLTLLILFLHQD